MVTILIRTLIVYACLIATMRFMGKRQLGELEISELVTTLLLSEIASLPITNQDIPLSYALLPILLLVFLEVLLSGVLLRFPKLNILFSNRPAIIIHHGKPDPVTMRSLRISIEELLSQLRQKDVADIDDVEYAILEPNGQISVTLRATERPPTTLEMGITPTEHGMMHLIVSDGKLNSRNLSLAHKDTAWLASVLRDHKIEMDQVFLLMVDDAGEVRLLPRKAS